MNTVFASQENAGLRSAAVKDRQRLKSAPEFTAEKGFKAPLTPRLGPAMTPFASCTPLQQRLALGSLKKVTQTPNVRPQREDPKMRCQEKEMVKPVDAKEPDIERMFPYSPDEFERYGTTDDVVYLSHLPLFGLPRVPWQSPLPEIDDIPPPPPIHPWSAPLPEESVKDDWMLDDFLLTLEEVEAMVPLPSPPEDPESP